MAGRKPKPTQLKVIQGTARKDRQVKSEPVPQGNLSDAPDHFCAERLAIWNYAIQNAPAGLLKRLDLSVLEIWVNAYVSYREAVRVVSVSGQTITTPNGFEMTSPHFTNMNKQAQLMMKAASEMGFTPASRTRVSVSEEAAKDDPWAEFGSK